MPTHPKINWHLSPVAQRIIARLDTANTELVRRVSIPADYFVLRGTDRFAVEAITALELIREVSIDEAVGFSFAEANTDKDNARRAAYLDATERAPEVTQVLEAAFADRQPVKVAASNSPHLTVDGWMIEPDYSTPFVGHTWTASSSTYEASVAAATYEELLDEIAAVEAEAVS